MAGGSAFRPDGKPPLLAQIRADRRTIQHYTPARQAHRTV
jgi:hypothetical protein